MKFKKLTSNPIQVGLVTVKAEEFEVSEITPKLKAMIELKMIEEITIKSTPKKSTPKK